MSPWTLRCQRIYNIPHKLWTRLCSTLIYCIMFLTDPCAISTHSFQGCFASTGTVKILPWFQRSNPKEYGQNWSLQNHNKSQHMNRVHISWSLWRHQMKTFPALLSLHAGNPPVTGGFPSQRVSNADLWCFFVVSLKKTVEQTLDL